MKYTYKRSYFLRPPRNLSLAKAFIKLTYNPYQARWSHLPFLKTRLKKQNFLTSFRGLEKFVPRNNSCQFNIILADLNDRN